MHPVIYVHTRDILIECRMVDLSFAVGDYANLRNFIVADSGSFSLKTHCFIHSFLVPIKKIEVVRTGMSMVT